MCLAYRIAEMVSVPLHGYVEIPSTAWSMNSCTTPSDRNFLAKCAPDARIFGTSDTSSHFGKFRPAACPILVSLVVFADSQVRLITERGMEERFVDILSISIVCTSLPTEGSSRRRSIAL